MNSGMALLGVLALVVFIASVAWIIEKNQAWQIAINIIVTTPILTLLAYGMWLASPSKMKADALNHCGTAVVNYVEVDPRDNMLYVSAKAAWGEDLWIMVEPSHPDYEFLSELSPKDHFKLLFTSTKVGSRSTFINYLRFNEVVTSGVKYIQNR